MNSDVQSTWTSAQRIVHACDHAAILAQGRRVFHILYSRARDRNYPNMPGLETVHYYMLEPPKLAKLSFLGFDSGLPNILQAPF